MAVFKFIVRPLLVSVAITNKSQWSYKLEIVIFHVNMFSNENYYSPPVEPSWEGRRKDPPSFDGPFKQNNPTDIGNIEGCNIP